MLVDINQRRAVATKAIQLFLKSPELADELSAARETLCHLSDDNDDRALDLATKIYAALPSDEPRRKIGAFINITSEGLNIDSRTLWRKDKLICDLFWKKYERLKNKKASE